MQRVGLSTLGPEFPRRRGTRVGPRDPQRAVSPSSTRSTGLAPIQRGAIGSARFRPVPLQTVVLLPDTPDWWSRRWPPALLCPLLINWAASLTGQGEPGTLSLVSAPDFWRHLVTGVLVCYCSCATRWRCTPLEHCRLPGWPSMPSPQAGVALYRSGGSWIHPSGRCSAAGFALDGWQGRPSHCWAGWATAGWRGMVFSVVTLLATNALLLLLSVVLLRQAR